MTYTEEKRRIKRRWNKKDICAVIVAVNGSIYDPVIRGNVWTQQRTSTGLSVAKSTLPPAGKLMTLNAGDDVYLEYFHRQLRIKEPNTLAAIAKGANPNALMQKFASGQITQAALQTLAVAANGSMVVTIKAWFPIVDGIAYQFAGTQDLTSDVPAAGQMCYALIAVKSDYTTIEVVTSTARAMTDIPLGLDDINEALTLLSVGSTPVRAHKLIGGQTVINQSDIDAPANPMDSVDLRQIVNTAPSGVGALTQAANGTVADTATETTLVGTVAGNQTFAAGALSNVGRQLRLSAWGYVSDTGTPTLRLKLKLGATVILDTGAITLGSDISNKLWRFEGTATVQTAGASGKLFAQGQFYQNGATTDIVSTGQVTIDLTTSLLADLTATWGTASASNTITCSNLSLEILN